MGLVKKREREDVDRELWLSYLGEVIERFGHGKGSGLDIAIFDSAAFSAKPSSVLVGSVTPIA